MKNGLSLQFKITAVLLACAIVPLTGTAVFAFLQAQNEITASEFEKLIAVRDLKKVQVEDWMTSRSGDITVYSGMPAVIAMCNQFVDAFDAPGGLNSAAWKQVEATYDSRLEEYIATYNFRDFYLISPEGDIVYSVKKEKDLGLNVKSGTLSGTGISQAYSKGQNAVSFIDFSWYDLLDIPAGFFGAPIRNPDGTLAGVLVYRFAGASIEKVLNNSAGQGETGETLLVGSDQLMRNNSRFGKEGESTMLKQKIVSAAAADALSGKTGYTQGPGYDGVPALSAYAPISLYGVNWGIIAKIYVSEAFAGIYLLRNISIIVVIVVIVMLTVIGLLFARSIGLPVRRITDELNGSSEQIASASTQLSETSQNIANGATEQASSIEEITASMEELSSMARQGLDNSRQVSTLSVQATDASQKGYEQMAAILKGLENLNESSDEIKKIVSVIDSIAFQTNILALNAAVEAARVGEAGMGFAVVADEVKSLANKSAESAKETSEMIEKSLTKIRESLEMSQGLSGLFQDILGSSRKVSEMAKEMELASEQQETGIDQISKAMTQLDQVVQTNASAAEESASSAEELLAQSDGLREMVIKMMKIVTGKEEEAEHRNTRSAGIGRGNGASSSVRSGASVHTAAVEVHNAARHLAHKDRGTVAEKNAGKGGNGHAPAFAGGGKNGGNKKSAVQTKKRPEDVIPFENDDEFEEM